MTEPDPGPPLTHDETRSWVDAVDSLGGTYLGDLRRPQLEDLVASMLTHCEPDDEWAPHVADAIRDRWAIQRADHLKAIVEQTKRTP